MTRRALLALMAALVPTGSAAVSRVPEGLPAPSASLSEDERARLEAGAPVVLPPGRHGRFVKVRVPVVTSARRFQAHGLLRQQAINALLLLAFHAGERPAALARLYQSGGGPRAIAGALGASALQRLRTRAARHRAGRELFERGEG